MCGIAGWIDFTDRNLSKETYAAERMNAALAPRGPDAAGVYYSADAVLCHRRLIVVDPENGVQPMTRRVGNITYTLVYNGELYNTQELKQELAKVRSPANGIHINSHSDTEVLLAAYIQWGADCLARFNGIFAFAVLTENAVSGDTSLFFARDRAGVKPFFYFKYAGGFVFASEVKALLAHPYVSKEIDRAEFAKMFLLSPARPRGSGVYKGVKELPPGYCGEFSRGNNFHTEQYWRLTAEPHRMSFEETSSEVRRLVSDSITRQLVSDVPLCTFLSGGLDSSIISAVAAAKIPDLATYSVDYKGNSENFVPSAFQPDADAPYIEEMSRYIGSNHTNVVLSTADTAAALHAAFTARDFPGMADVDSSLMLFCKAVRERYTVAVSGECADELFGGYPWYSNPEILHGKGFPWAKSAKLRAGLLRKDIFKDVFGEFADEGTAEQYVQSECAGLVADTHYSSEDTEQERRMREMFMLNFYGFMQVLLERKDRMSMACGLEVRVPFCDHRIAQLAYNIPWEQKYYKNREKGLLRHTFESLLPQGVAWRKKSPYPKTHDPVYSKIVGDMLRDVISKDCKLANVFDIDAIRALLDEPQKNIPWFGQLMNTPQIYATLLAFEWFL